MPRLDGKTVLISPDVVNEILGVNGSYSDWYLMSEEQRRTEIVRPLAEKLIELAIEGSIHLEAQAHRCKNGPHANPTV